MVASEPFWKIRAGLKTPFSCTDESIPAFILADEFTA